MGKILTNKQKSKLSKQLKSAKGRREADRIRAVLAYDAGEAASAIARFFFVDESTVRLWLKDYEEQGPDDFTKSKNSGKPSSLDDKQEEALKAELESRLYRTTREIIQFVQRRFQVTFSLSGMTKLLHRLGFSYKKPKGVPAKAKLQEQLEFIKKLEGIVPNSLVFFGDSTHPTLNAKLATGWIKKGADFEVKTSSGRHRVNVNGAIEVNSLQVIARTCQAVNEGSILELLRAIRQKNPKSENVFLVLDNATYNKTNAVRSLAEELSIRLLYLPAYSPNLNPIERLWKFMKSEVLGNTHFDGLPDFRAAITNFFRTIRHRKAELRSLITTNFRPVGN